MAFGSCKKLKTPDSIEERENWYASFSDSVKYYENKYQQTEDELQKLNSEISELLQGFEKVKKPREVSGYFIVKGWASKTPLTSSGLYARIDENEKLELIATLGGSTFNQISVGNFNSEVVKHDQALNYRHESYNTVFFSGGKADTVAQYIAENKSNALKLDFMESGKRKSQFLLPENEKDMIAKTWQVFSLQRMTKTLQKELAMCSRKIDTFRRMKDEHNEQQKPIEHN